MKEFLPKFEELREVIDLKTAVIFLAVWLLVLMSASLSASIAEKRSHARLIHAILGGVIVIIYPLFILVTLKASKSKNTTYVEEGEVSVDAELPGDDFNSSYFKSIYLDTEGNLRGPFIIELQDEVVRANCIPEVHKEFIVVEVDTISGKSQRIRVPYSKITSCNEA